MGARESLTVKSNRLDNGDNNCEKTENDTDDELLVKMPFAGTTLSIRLLFYPEEPWIPPDFSFSDIQFASSITTKDLKEQVYNNPVFIPFFVCVCVCETLYSSLALVILFLHLVQYVTFLEMDKLRSVHLYNCSFPAFS